MKALANGLKKAVIELLILKLLSEKDMYGYQLSQEFRKRSNNRFSLLEGSMYPILYRLSDSGYISFYEKKIGKRQTRVYYHLEESGTSYLKQMQDEYHETVQIIDFLLESKEGESLDVFEQEGN